MEGEGDIGAKVVENRKKRTTNEGANEIIGR
jgi:hypothetical protein